MDKLFFSSVLIEKCVDNINDKQCIFGSSLIIINIVLFSFLIYGFVKMTKFYEELNFENSIILGCILQSAIMLLVIITSLNFILEIFYFFQILMVSYVLQRMIIISKDNEEIDNSSNNNNLTFIIINIFNIFIFSLFQISIHFHFTHEKKRIFETIYRSYSIIINLILLYYGLKVINLIIEKNKNNDKLISLKHTSLLSKGTLSNYGQIKKSQIKMLIYFNLLFSILQFIFNIMKNYILTNHFSTDKKDMTTNPKSTLGIFLYNIYLLICIMNIFLNFITFFWCIREQYDLIFYEEDSLYATIKINERETTMYKGRESSKKYNNEDFSTEDIQKYIKEGGKDINDFLKKSLSFRKKSNNSESFDSYSSPDRSKYIEKVNSNNFYDKDKLLKEENENDNNTEDSIIQNVSIKNLDI